MLVFVGVSTLDLDLGAELEGVLGESRGAALLFFFFLLLDFFD